MNGILFDLDGVLMNSMPAHVRSWQRAFRRCAGMKVPSKELYAREGQALDETVSEIYRRWSGGRPGRKLVCQIIAQKDAFYRSSAGVRLFPKARDLLEGLHQQGLVLAVVSGSLDLLTRLRAHRIDGLFSVIVSPAQTRHSKPNPEPYLVAVRELGLPRERCLVIENSPFGIRAAREAMLPCVAVKGNSPLSAMVLRNSGAIVVFRSISQLQAVLERGSAGAVGAVEALASAVWRRSLTDKAARTTGRRGSCSREGLIVVLGGPNSDEGELSSIARERCLLAYDLHRRHPTYGMIPTGGFGAHFNRSAFAHGTYVRAFLIQLGVPPELILDPIISSNTLEDARLLGQFIRSSKPGQVLVVTSDYHLERARFIFERVLADAIGWHASRTDASQCTVDLAALELHEDRALESLRTRGVPPAGVFGTSQGS